VATIAQRLTGEKLDKFMAAYQSSVTDDQIAEKMTAAGYPVQGKTVHDWRKALDMPPAKNQWKTNETTIETNEKPTISADMETPVSITSDVMEIEQAPVPRPKFAHTVRAAVLNPPNDIPMPDARMELMEREIALLREQLTWAQHSESRQRTGGKATLVRSDDHYTDRAHTIRAHDQLTEKALIVLEQYQPDIIEVLYNGDAVAGRGIYKNQEMDSCLMTGEEQGKVASWKVYQFWQVLKARFPRATIKFRFTNGNHDRAMGEPLMPQLVVMLRALGIPAVYQGDTAILNVASVGTYHVLCEHGYGHSAISPSSPKWLSTMQEKIINLYRRGYVAEKRIRRVNHGHTHFFSLGLERIRDLYYDTTGGCQRNDRTSLGKNSRPQGWIVYISPAGLDGILNPIGIQPDVTVQDEETDDPYLFKRNTLDCMESLERYGALLEQLGISEITEPVGR